MQKNLLFVTLLISILLLQGCCVTGSNNIGFGSTQCIGPELKGTLNFSPPTNLNFTVSDSSVSGSSQFTASCDIGTGLQAHSIQMVIPPQFGFAANGFQALPAGAAIAVYGIDVNADGVIEDQVNAIASGQFTGWIDMNKNTIQDPSEPGFFYSNDAEGNHLLNLDLPLGGDGSASFFTGSIPLSLSMSLSQGLFTNPGQSGCYPMRASFQSIDVDTGGADNGAGTPPQNFTLTSEMSIGGSDLCNGTTPPVTTSPIPTLNNTNLILLGLLVSFIAYRIKRKVF
ncbi:MAG: hypothetical protein ACWA5R_11350 [bacterium]